MGLRDIANKTLSGFDAKTDHIIASAGLPAGDYTAVVETVEHRAFDSGWDCFGTTFQVVEGEHAGQRENVNVSLAEQTKSGKAIPDFILDRNIKFITKLGALLGVEITASDFGNEGTNETDIHEHLANKLHDKAGEVVILTVQVRPNKKDPSNPYTSYDLTEAEQPTELPADDPFESNGKTTVNDDDLPFD